MPRRSAGGRPLRRQSGPGRYFAPLALGVVVIVVIVIVVSTGGSSNAPDQGVAFPTATSPRSTHATSRGRVGVGVTTGTATTGGLASGTATTGSATTGTGTTGTTTAGTYTVASGDTFATISAATGVPLSTIETLNPGASSSDLSIGQVLKLKPAASH